MKSCPNRKVARIAIPIWPRRTLAPRSAKTWSVCPPSRSKSCSGLATKSSGSLASFPKNSRQPVRRSRRQTKRGRNHAARDPLEPQQPGAAAFGRRRHRGFDSEKRPDVDPHFSLRLFLPALRPSILVGAEAVWRRANSANHLFPRSFRAADKGRSLGSGAREIFHSRSRTPPREDRPPGARSAGHVRLALSPAHPSHSRNSRSAKAKRDRRSVARPPAWHRIDDRDHERLAGRMVRPTEFFSAPLRRFAARAGGKLSGIVKIPRRRAGGRCLRACTGVLPLREHEKDGSRRRVRFQDSPGDRR